MHTKLEMTSLLVTGSQLSTIYICLSRLDNLALNSLIYFKPMERFQNRSLYIWCILEFEIRQAPYWACRIFTFTDSTNRKKHMYIHVAGSGASRKPPWSPRWARRAAGSCDIPWNRPRNGIHPLTSCRPSRLEVSEHTAQNNKLLVIDFVNVNLYLSGLCSV
jgi:hypothetical protein